MVCPAGQTKEYQISSSAVPAQAAVDGVPNSQLAVTLTQVPSVGMVGNAIAFTHSSFTGGGGIVPTQILKEAYTLLVDEKV